MYLNIGSLLDFRNRLFLYLCNQCNNCMYSCASLYSPLGPVIEAEKIAVSNFISETMTETEESEAKEAMKEPKNEVKSVHWATEGVKDAVGLQERMVHDTPYVQDQDGEFTLATNPKSSELVEPGMLFK